MKIIPTVAAIYHCTVDTLDNSLVSCSLTNPGSTTIINSDAAEFGNRFTTTQRGNSISTSNYIINNGIDPRNIVIPGYAPKNSYDELTAPAIDSLFRVDYNYFSENGITSDFILDISAVGCETPNNGGNNIYLLNLMALFTSFGYEYTAITN